MKQTLLSILLLSGLCGGCASNDPELHEPVDVGESPGNHPKVTCPPELKGFATGEHGLRASDPERGITVRLEDARYQPPIDDFNDWTIAVLDADGKPLEAHLSWVCSDMTVHDHSANPRMVRKLDAGRFELVKLNFSMTGPWNVRLWLDTAEDAVDYLPQHGSATLDGKRCLPSNGAAPNANVVFEFCVPENRDGS